MGIFNIHCGYNRSSEDASSLIAPGPTFFCRGLCLLYSCFVFLLWTFDFEYYTVRYHRILILTKFEVCFMLFVVSCT